MKHRPTRRLAALLAAGALVLAACGDDDDGTDATGSDTSAPSGSASAPEGEGTCSSAQAPDDAPEITVAVQDFYEQKILAQLYVQCLQAAGFDADAQELSGNRSIELEAFSSGDIDLAAEYAASMLEFLNDQAGEATADAQETTELLNGRLEELGLVALTPSEAVDTNSFVVTQETADELGISTISDLADHTDLRFGAPSDCPENPFCLPGLEQNYGIDLSGGYVSLEGDAIAASLGEGAIDIGLIFSTDPQIAENGWVVLEDDQGMFSADNVVPVVTAELAEIDVLVELLDAISAALTTEDLTAMNAQFVIETEDEEDIAAEFLAANGLV